MTPLLDKIFEPISHPLPLLFFSHSRTTPKKGGQEGGVTRLVMMTHMLVDQNDADILALRRELLERGLDGLGLGLAVDDEEVLLRVGRVRDVLFEIPAIR